MPRRSRSRSKDRSRDDRHKSSKRSRSRSRERSSKHRSRDRSRDKSRDRGDRRRDRRSNFSDAETAQQVAAMQAYQQESIQRQLMAQQLMLAQQGGGLASGKKQREVYVGNLTIGVVTDQMLKELFNGALAHLVPDPIANPPVVNAQLDPSGRFGFVEMRTEELATSGMQLDKVELCGRQINVGRPKGYNEPPGGAAAPAQLGAAQLFAASLANQGTKVVLLENMLKAYQLLDDTERQDLLDEVKDECPKYGTVLGVAVPKPPAGISHHVGGRVYVRFATPDEAKKAKDVFNGRQFDGNTISAKSAPEEEFDRANVGQWTGPFEVPPVFPPPPSMGGY